MKVRSDSLILRNRHNCVRLQVYLPAIQGHVPDAMVRAIGSFLDFCYLARRSDINEDTLRDLDSTLQQFYLHREVFRDTNVRPTGFSLPRQHALAHYHALIEDFGAPGGICSSITESRHITAVKKPWRRSNRYEALGQMLLTNQRLDKLAGARVEYVKRGLLDSTRVVPVAVVDAVRTGQVLEEDDETGEWTAVDAERVDFVEGNVTLARQHGELFPEMVENTVALLIYHTSPRHYISPISIAACATSRSSPAYRAHSALSVRPTTSR